jgi:hypothetical protein
MAPSSSQGIELSRGIIIAFKEKTMDIAFSFVKEMVRVSFKW